MINELVKLDSFNSYIIYVNKDCKDLPPDLQRVVGNPEKDRKILGWSSNHDLEWIVSEMFENKINFQG